MKKALDFIKQEGVALFVMTLIGSVLAYFLQFSYASYFKIPYELAIPTTYTVIFSIISILIILFIYFSVSAQIYAFFKSLKIRIIFVVAFLALSVLGLIIAHSNHFIDTSPVLFGALSLMGIITFLNLLDVLIRKPKKLKKTAKKSDSQLAVLIYNRLYLIMGNLLLLILCSIVLGILSAYIQTQFYMFSLEGKYYAVVYSSQNYFVTKEYDSKKNTLLNQVRIVSFDEIKENKIILQNLKLKVRPHVEGSLEQ